MALVRFVNGRWSKPPGGQTEIASLAQRSVPRVKALLREMRQRQIIEAEDLRANATDAQRSWNRYRIRPQREWLPASAAPKKPRARTLAISAKQREGSFDLRVRGQGSAEIPGEPEIRLRAAGHAADIVTIRGAKLSSLRIPEEARVEIGVVLAPEKAKEDMGLPATPSPTSRTSADAGMGSPATPSPGPQHAPAKGMGSPATPSPSPGTPPAWVPAETWNAFVQMRAAIGRPLATSGQVHSIIRKLEELRAQGEDIQAVLDQSLRGSHAEVFAVRKFADRGAATGNGHARGKNQSRVGEGPSLPEPSYCWKCGRTKAYHSRPLENIQREDPKWIPHEFARNPGNAA